MLLEKWYADVVEDGHAQIRYRANLRLGPLTIGYSSEVEQGRTSPPEVVMHPIPMPSVHEGAVHWPVRADADALAWSCAATRPRQLWSSDKHAITWDPIVLSGQVSVAGEERRHARGYVERLTLNIVPWRLGLQRLRWGRFCGRQHSLAWIEWEGSIPRRFALLDGRPDTLVETSARTIRTELARLAIEERREIVNAPIGSGALNGLSLFKAFGARQFLSGVETKWLAAATLELPGFDADWGHVIHEEVVWPQRND